MRFCLIVALALSMATSFPSVSQTIYNGLNKKAYETKSIFLYSSSDEQLKNFLGLSGTEKQLNIHYSADGENAARDRYLIIRMKEFSLVHDFISSYMKNIECKYVLDSSNCSDFKKYYGFTVALNNGKAYCQMEFHDNDCNKLNSFFSNFESWIKENTGLSSACKTSLQVHITRLRNLNLN